MDNEIKDEVATKDGSLEKVRNDLPERVDDRQDDLRRHPDQTEEREGERLKRQMLLVWGRGLVQMSHTPSTWSERVNFPGLTDLSRASPLPGPL